MLIPKKIGIIIFLLVGIFWAGIVAAEDIPMAEPDVLSQATAFEQAGDKERALSLLRQYVLENPAAEHTYAAYAQLSRILQQHGRFEQARLYAERIPASEQPADLMLLLARARLRRNDSAAAAGLLKQIDTKSLNIVQQQEYLQAQTELELQRGNLMQVLVFCARLMESEDDEQDVAASVFNTGMQALERMNSVQLLEAEFMFMDTPIGALLTLHELRTHTGTKVEHGSDVYQKGEKLVLNGSHAWIRKQALTWLDQIEGGFWQQRALGVVLPLSGRYAPFGRMVKQGIELATQLRGADAPELIVRDSRADAMHTELIVRELIQTQRVMAVLGPMMGEGAVRAARVAQQEEVPIVLLSHREGLPQLGSYVFRHSLTAKQQAYALAGFAINTLNLQTFALLQPENKLGNDFTRHFRQSLELLGAEVVYHSYYPPGSTDFRAALAPMAPKEVEDVEQDKVSEERFGAVASLEETEPNVEPKVEYDAIFIPDFADTIALLAPQLAFADIEDVQLLGINGWNSSDLLSQAGRYVRDAIFTDGFDPESSDIFVQRFVTQYRSRYAEAPTILEAQGYDAANLLLDLLHDARVKNSRQVQNLLQQIDYTTGVSGLRGFDADGEALREILLFQFGRKRIQRIDSTLLQTIDTQEPEEDLFDRVSGGSLLYDY